MITVRGVTFRAWRHETFVPLVEVLLVLGADTLGRRWSLTDTEFAPGWRGSEELARLAAAGTTVPTLRLVDLVADGIQLVGGTLRGDDEGGQRPPLVIRSVRGDEWDVEAGDAGVLAAVRSHFPDAQDLPGSG